MAMTTLSKIKRQSEVEQIIKELGISRGREDKFMTVNELNIQATSWRSCAAASFVYVPTTRVMCWSIKNNGPVATQAPI